MRKTPTASSTRKPVTPAASVTRSSTPPSVARTKSSATGSGSSSPLHHASAAAATKRKDSASVALEKDYLIASLKEQIAGLEAKLEDKKKREESSVAQNPDTTPITPPLQPTQQQQIDQSPSIKIAELQSKLKMQEILISQLEAKVTAFISKDSAISYLAHEKESNEARLDMIIKDKDMTIETMRKQIEMQVSGLFSEVSKSRELLVTQSETHAEDLRRLNNMIASQAAELGQLREKLKERGVEDEE
ncbi:UNVERIFIED_CONTAM: hypothetical protein HDU68_000282 [Siphonaria sp. JEL0065]|nr:hypothetical protein HDU68_000282 [Siphonaria sp. JEL0065]